MLVLLYNYCKINNYIDIKLGSVKTTNAKIQKSSMGLKDMLSLLRPQEISVDKLRDPFSLPKPLMPKPKVVSVKVVVFVVEEPVIFV